VISEKALHDPQAVSLAEAVAAANEKARAVGMDTDDWRILVEQETSEKGTPLWRVSYMPIPPPGVRMRGGDYIVEVDATTGAVYRTMHGQ